MKVFSALITLFVVSSAFADTVDNPLDKYISDLKQKSFEFDYQKNEAESSKLRDSWIAPLNISYSESISNPFDVKQTNKDAAILMNQPIFRSGGIYYGIKFAEHSKKYSQYSIDVAKRKLIKDTIATLMQIKQIDLQIQKQKLQVSNADINFLIKQEQYLSGQLDSSFLDDAILQKNAAKLVSYDLQTSKERLLSQFRALSDLNPTKVQIPHLQLINKEDFLSKNIALKMTDAQVKRDEYAKDVAIAKYLPQVNLTAGYNWSFSDTPFTFSRAFLERDYYNYGIRASLPIDLNSFRDIESSRIDFLKSQVIAQDKQRELNALFEQVVHNLENLDKKKQLSKDNIAVYAKLLKDTKELYNAGYKTQYDVDILSNSLEISFIEMKIYEIDKQLELLTLYEMYVNEI